MIHYLSEEQLQFWKDNGFIIIKDYFTDKQKAELVEWVEDLETRPETAGKWTKYFETPSNNPKGRQLCRVENFLQFHEGFDNLLQGPKLIGVLFELMDEPAVLFKEKINFKLPGGNGFLPHQDAPAFTSFGQTFHITLMVSIDASNPENGCLQMARGMHDKGMLPTAPDATVDAEFAKTLNWEYVETEPGDIVLFDSYIPHKSDANMSNRPRRALYITYNRASEGSYRDEYYEEKRKVFPPDVERDPNKTYGDSGVFNVGNPVIKM